MPRGPRKGAPDDIGVDASQLEELLGQLGDMGGAFDAERPGGDEMAEQFRALLDNLQGADFGEVGGLDGLGVNPELLGKLKAAMGGDAGAANTKRDIFESLHKEIKGADGRKPYVKASDKHVPLNNFDIVMILIFSLMCLCLCYMVADWLFPRLFKKNKLPKALRNKPKAR